MRIRLTRKKTMIEKLTKVVKEKMIQTLHLPTTWWEVKLKYLLTIKAITSQMTDKIWILFLNQEEIISISSSQDNTMEVSNSTNHLRMEWTTPKTELFQATQTSNRTCRLCHQQQTHPSGRETTITLLTRTETKCWLMKFSHFTCTEWVTESTILTTRRCWPTLSSSENASMSTDGERRSRAKA